MVFQHFNLFPYKWALEDVTLEMVGDVLEVMKQLSKKGERAKVLKQDIFKKSGSQWEPDFY